MIHLLLLIVLHLGWMQPAESQQVSLNVKVFLEGPYDSNSGKMKTKLFDLGYLPGMRPKTFFAKAVPMHDPYATGSNDQRKTRQVSFTYSDQSVDWVHILIREEDSKKTVYRETMILQADGSLLADPIDESLFLLQKKYTITVIHRNHLPIESPPLSLRQNLLSFDFTSSDHVMNTKIIESVHVMYAGNIFEGGDAGTTSIINDDDYKVWQSANGKNSSYLIEDVDLDGDVSVHDKSIIFNNIDVSTSVIIHE